MLHPVQATTLLDKEVKRAAKILGALIGLCALLIGSCVGYFAWRAHLPSDRRAEEVFREHKEELDKLVAMALSAPEVTYVNADEIGLGENATEPKHVALAQSLKKLGAQFLRRSDGVIEIYFWGTGCAICHDSFKGYAFILPGARLLKFATVVPSLEDKALPKGKYAPIDDGSYIKPLEKSWYLIRWECG